ncbi:MAG TPA: amylo-alpha-1,6-glucosidase [Candidatus Sulfotelmatobacter sp.]|nr:amylo-alpha-1,6-glucosidase [Candidatus Sulfotelmatobacter sp.]
MEQPRPVMSPAPGARILRFVGDKIRFSIRDEANAAPKNGSQGFLRTNLGRAAMRRQEIIYSHALGAAFAGESWRDVPMQKNGDTWEIEFPLAETGYFKAKPYLLDSNRWQHWPDGPDAGISVQPNCARTSNTIYCAFTRLFGATRTLSATKDEKLDAQIKPLDAKNFTVIPPSGTLRDLTKQLPHIVQNLGCRILQLLPVHPTPTTYARFGRFGSPYAALDLTAIDPALVEFDKRTTGVEQFCELTRAAHAMGARVFLDIVINHTGWGSVLQENCPEFFLKNPDGQFASPGAWGTVWEDLVELKQDSVVLWDKIADALLIWCARGTDGFRCDAGYKIPVVAWQYIIARVHEEFPDTIFLLEGLGGSWEATENLLAEGGMQWAYSELFQNYSGHQVAWYLDYANRQSERVGTYVHFSETHDNDRLASRPGAASGRPNRAWSLLRNRLCALTSPSGGFGFTCGVEWLATEKINVHGCTGLNWENSNNIVPELARLNDLISNHPCFFDGARLTRLSGPDAPIYLLLRESAEGMDSLLVVVNTDAARETSLALSMADCNLAIADFKFDLLGQALPEIAITKNSVTLTLNPGAVHCLAPSEKPAGLSGENYRRTRAQAAFAVQALNSILAAEQFSNFDWKFLAEQIEQSPEHFLAAAMRLKGGESQARFSELIAQAARDEIYPPVITWTLIDRRRVTLVPAGHWLLVEESAPFQALLKIGDVRTVRVASIPAGQAHVAVFAPRDIVVDAQLVLERHATASQKISSAIRFLPIEAEASSPAYGPASLTLLTNGIGGMARLCVDLGRVNSKYDCVLGANLNPNYPVDRHIFVKRVRGWVNADGFLSPLNFTNLREFEMGPPAVWNFVANAGDGRTVEIMLRAEMLQEKNTVLFQFFRPAAAHATGKQLPGDADVRLTVRMDIEDRNFHQETRRNGGAEYHFSTNTHLLNANSGEQSIGFAFTPDRNRQLRIFADKGEFHAEPEWCENIPHPVEASRGQVPSGDAYSPGWFEIPLQKGTNATVAVTAEMDPADLFPKMQPKPASPAGSLDDQLLRAARQFVVRRDPGKTVIAGYPWFLDWGRDSLICARGLLAAGMIEEVEQLLLTFAKFEQNGTLPNTIHGNDVSNRDTSDAPLWFAVACGELTRLLNRDFYATAVDGRRAIRDVLASIADNYTRGTSNGIHMDADSALIWSPAHFTWMDTNYPAGTPREGYPVELQALWIALLRQLETVSDSVAQTRWRGLADHATASFEKLFWLEDKGWLADVLLGSSRVIAHDATASDALRSNCLLPVSLGLVTGARAKRCVAAAQKYLAVPGAMRSLAPLPVSVPLPVFSNAGSLINDPVEPYWPRYEGDEDTRRKPAYHNGTAWTWKFPIFCEALARAWNFAPEAVAAAKSYIASAEKVLAAGCLGQIPEIMDGDAPHPQRGCDAQAWGVTEFLRVSKLLGNGESSSKHV